MGVAPAVELEPGLPEPPGVVRHGAGHLVGQERHQAGDGQGDQDLHQGEAPPHPHGASWSGRCTTVTSSSSEPVSDSRREIR